jgi:hypothetical protein
MRQVFVSAHDSLLGRESASSWFSESRTSRELVNPPHSHHVALNRQFSHRPLVGTGEARKNGLSSSTSCGFPWQEARRPQLNFNLWDLDEQPGTCTSDNSTLHHPNTIEAPQICTIQARNIACATQPATESEIETSHVLKCKNGSPHACRKSCQPPKQRKPSPTLAIPLAYLPPLTPYN